MREGLCAALATATLMANAAGGGELLKPLDRKDFRVVVVFVTTHELMELQRRHGANVDRRDIRQSHRRGFSILKTNRETGARTCEIYLPAEHQLRVDDHGTMSLGHELMHCMYGDYHR